MHLGLIGKSLKHSFSKKYFTEKFEQEGLSGHSYSNFELSDISELPTLLTKNRQLAGLNVTIPYKETVLPYLNTLSAAAKKIGAVNTIRIRDKQMEGFNTDVYGFEESLRPLLPKQPLKALILGSGGASKAVAFVLRRLNIDYEIVSRLAGDTHLSYVQASDSLDDYLLVVNTTPLGTFPSTEEMPALRLDKVSKNHLIYDLVYNPEKTRLLAEAEKHGASIKNGHEMLILQAEKAWEIWNEF